MYDDKSIGDNLIIIYATLFFHSSKLCKIEKMWKKEPLKILIRMNY